MTVDPLVELLLDKVMTAIASKRYHHGNERELQDAIEMVLFDAGLEVEREVALSARDRIDFTVGNIGIEVKIKGSRGDLARQIIRYAKHPGLDGVILVTPRATLRIPDTTSEGKPIRTVYLNPLA